MPFNPIVVPISNWMYERKKELRRKKIEPFLNMKNLNEENILRLFSKFYIERGSYAIKELKAIRIFLEGKVNKLYLNKLSYENIIQKYATLGPSLKIMLNQGILNRQGDKEVSVDPKFKKDFDELLKYLSKKGDRSILKGRNNGNGSILK